MFDLKRLELISFLLPTGEDVGLCVPTLAPSVLSFATDPREQKGKPGILSILHSWSQVLIDHFLIHCLVPAAVLSFDGRQWIASHEPSLRRSSGSGVRHRRRDRACRISAT